MVPAYQRTGVGGQLLRTVQDYILRQIGTDWAVSLELIGTREAVGFYARFGFEQRPCNWDGPGMFKMLRSIEK